MKKGWKNVLLKNICKVIAGQSPNGSNYNKSGEGLPFYQGKKEFGEKYIGEPKIWTTQVTRQAESGDILMSVRAPVGPINFSSQRICIGRGLAAIRPKKEINREFLYYGLFALQHKIKGNEGAVFASINKKQIQNLPFCLPPLPEQRRIAAILDEAFAAIATATANAEKNLAHAQELFESELNRVFTQRGEGWVEKRLGDICVLRNGRAYKKSELLDKGKYKVLRVGNFFTNKKWFYSDLELDETKYCDKGDLLYAWSASFGPQIWDDEKVIFHYHIWRVDPSQLVTKDFLYRWLAWDAQQIQAEHGAGTTMVHVSKSSMEARLLHLPPISEQKVIIDNLRKIEKEAQHLESIYQQKLALLAELRQSLLHKAFSGELTGDPKKTERALSEAGV